MENIKKFNAVELVLAKNLLGKKLKNIFYQPTEGLISDDNMFVVNFGDKIEFSMHVFCFLRIRFKNNIILTSSDEYFTKDFHRLTAETYETQKKFEKSLLYKNIKATKKLLKTAIITDVNISDIGDIKIVFDNLAQIEIILDCLYNDYEYYRFFKCDKKDTPHYCFIFTNGEIICEIIN